MVALAALTLYVGLAQRPAGEPALTLGFYMVTSCESPAASPPMRLAGAAKPYCFERSPILSQTDVASAALDKDQKGNLFVVLTLKEAAAERIYELTATSIGLEIGQFLNGQLRRVAVIEAPSRRAYCSRLTEQEAASVVAAFQRGDVARIAPVLPPGKLVTREKPFTTAPFPIYRREPEYTERARAARIEGTVVLEVIIQPDGKVEVLRVVRSLDPDLDAKAIECARTWRFRPGTKDGKPVAVTATIEVNFRLL